MVGGIVELNPVVALVVVVGKDGIGGADLIDAHGGVTVFAVGIGHLAEGSHELEAVARREVQGGITGDVARGVVGIAPSHEAVASARLGPQCYGREECAVVLAVGHAHVVDINISGFGGLNGERHLLLSGTTEAEALILLHLLDEPGGTAFQLLAHLVERAVGAGSFPCHGLAHAVAQLVTDLGRTRGLEHTAHGAEDVDEASAEVVVLEQVEEESTEFYLAVAPLTCIIYIIVAVPLHAIDPTEGVAVDLNLALLVGGAPVGAEGGVEVEEGDAEAATVGQTIGLEVVVGPVPRAEVKLGSHVIYEFIYIYEFADLGIGVGLCGCGREVVEV